MLDREDIKQTNGYKLLLSLNDVKDVSGPGQQKSGAFQFRRRGDYGEYKIIKTGDVKRQSAGPAFELGHINKDSITSYSAAFKKIREKMEQIEEKQNREHQLAEEAKAFNNQLIYDMADGKPIMSKVKYHNLIKKAFKGGLNEHDWSDGNDWDNYILRRWIDTNNSADIDACKRLVAIPGAMILFKIIAK